MTKSSLASTPGDWLRPQRLEYVPLDRELAVVRVVAGLGRGAQPPVDAALVAGAPHSVVRAPVLGSVTHRPSRRRRSADHLLWRVTFALPLELLECPQAVFALTAREYLPARLPSPRESTLEALSRDWDLGSRGAGILNAAALRRAAAVSTAVAVAGTSVLPPAVALAAAGHRSHRIELAHAAAYHAKPALHRAHTIQSGGTATLPHVSRHQVVAASASSDKVVAHAATHGGSAPAGSVQADPRRVAVDHHRAHRGQSHSAPVAAPAPASSSAQPTQGGSPPPAPQSQPSSPGAPSSLTNGAHHRHHGHHGAPGSTHAPTPGNNPVTGTISPAPPASLLPGPGVSDPRADLPGHSGSGSAPGHGHHRHSGSGHGKRGPFSGGSGLSPLTPRPPVHRDRPTAQDETPPVSPRDSSSGSLAPSSSAWTSGMALTPAELALLSHLSGSFSKALQPPTFLIPIYKKAGKRFHLPWQILAAINSIETDYGRNLNVSSAGAIGWMQFMPSTWAEYGMSVNGRGTPNPYDPTDAIFSAAHYLAVNGGGRHLRQAIFAYNHAQWYVDAVMWRADQILEHTARPDAGAKSKIANMLTAAQLLNGLPYVYGGGHGAWGPNVGYDCSGFVSAVLHAAGYLTAPQDTQTLPDQPGILSGPGKWVTIFDRTDAGSLSEDHVIIDVDGQFWESGGSTSAGGAARVHHISQISLAYLATFNRILHPQGL